ncbi:hypothetical protein CYLTODRAFT_418678 [Cylindrobasidium torrendii FP15055 ss-10]|uniref:Anaphase-promoting complex subunit 4 n=1 Tax=Cylindrobasidium torrendii FP15055 ss-10 TaxID=1314674 RepID=A0A0D7BM13_9AGAR|nr:hypothetical protein CYLTODRAFT_418678 [Cylindrobasidium torrendii FP15055 ss-10]
MQEDAFDVLSLIALPGPSRLFWSACCADKDLVVVATSVGTNERLSLWKNNGIRCWEVGIDGREIVDVAWSPDARSIAVAIDENQISIRSIETGQEEKRFSPGPSADVHPAKLAAIWWVEQPKVKTQKGPDIFRKGDVLTGSARSIISTLPLLDRTAEEMQRNTATDLFAFQGSRTQSQTSSTIPSFMTSWPSIDLDPVVASIGILPPGQKPDPRVSIFDDSDNVNENSMVMAADDQGSIICFLEGRFPSGTISVKSPLDPTCLLRHPQKPVFFVHRRDANGTALSPTGLEIPLLSKRSARDMAVLSSMAKLLVTYIIRVTAEMRACWFGSDMMAPANAMGPKWLKAFEAKIKDHVNAPKEATAMLELTTLLLTGRASEALSDFLQSAEQMSERSMKKWDTTVSDALLQLRDWSEKRMAPACQRLHLILEELLGWSELHEYEAFRLQRQELENSLELTSRTIILTGWLASVARREYGRFREFMTWVKYETEVLAHASNAGATPETHPPLRHDILEVNKYLMSGLASNEIDKWFSGAVPTFSAHDLHADLQQRSLPDAMKRAREALMNSDKAKWQELVPQKSISHLERNIDALTDELARQCMRTFTRASSALGRAARIRTTANPSNTANKQVLDARLDKVLSRQHTKVEESANGILQYLAMVSLDVDSPNAVCLARVKYKEDLSAEAIEVALLECSFTDAEGAEVKFDVLDMQFFDDVEIIVVYRLREQEGAFIASFGYSDLGYKTLDYDGDGILLHGREDLMAYTLSRWVQGQVASQSLPIRRCRRLAGCESGPASLAVNGRVGRRVACVLDGSGSSLEILDIEGGAEEDEDEDEQLSETDERSRDIGD